MSKAQKKLQKKKQRDKEIKKQKLETQKKTTIANREIREGFRKQRASKKMQKQMEEWEDKILKNLTKEQRDRLKKNSEMMAALEEEFYKEMKERKDLNEMLEKEGFKTLEEKFKAMKERSMQEAMKYINNPSTGGAGGTAIVDVIPAEEHRKMLEAQEIGLGGGAEYSFKTNESEENEKID